MICHWPLLEHPLEHHELVILLLPYNNLVGMLSAMELCHPKQDVIFLSHFSIHNMVKTLQSDTRKHLYYGKVTSCIRNTNSSTSIFVICTLWLITAGLATLMPQIYLLLMNTLITTKRFLNDKLFKGLKRMKRVLDRAFVTK